MVTIPDALSRVKKDLAGLIEEHVNKALAEQHALVWRNRLLNPLTTMLLFITQILHGNTAINHLRQLGGMQCTATAYCKARQRLPLSLFQRIAAAVARALDGATDQCARWRGHRVWRVDASTFSMPDTPALQKHFGQPGGQAPGCGFPVATLLTLCSATGFIVKTLALPLRTHEASQVAALHQDMQPGDVLVGDRAFCSFVHLILLCQQGLHAIVRMHQRQIVSFRPGRRHARQFPKGQRRGKPTSQWIERLGRCDQLVRWFKPDDKPRWMSREAYTALPDSLVVRELRYQVHRRGFRTRTVTLATTLLDAEAYPATELAEQYFGRWDIELNFRHLKTTMGMDVVKCKTVAGVLKELAVFVLVYNLVRLVMLRAAERQQVPLARISFVDALRWLTAVGDARGLIDLVVNPERPDRVEPRVLKRRMKQYPLMTKPRQVLRQALISPKLVD